MDELYCEVVDKYGIALCGLLYPTQIEQLKKCLVYYKRYDKIPMIEDAFTRLAFMMIVSDLRWQQNQKGRVNDYEKE